MKAVCVIPGRKNSIHLRDVPMPQISDIIDGRGVLVKVLSVGVDGTDKEITATDALFTLLAYSNEIVNTQALDYCWIKDIFIDPLDNSSFHLIVDGNQTSAELEPYCPIFNKLNIHFYQNSF